jgi:hypothetical protein
MIFTLKTPHTQIKRKDNPREDGRFGISLGGGEVGPLPVSPYRKEEQYVKLKNLGVILS